MSRFDLVIFDCDGVLIDSERLAIRTESQILTELGWPLTEEEVINRFVGRSSTYMQSVIEEKIGRPVDWKAEFERRVREVCERELVPVDGVVAVLDELTVPSCVASSSGHQMLAFKLGLTGLAERFAGRIFSADDVAHGKPDPAVFLFAAASMGAAPESLCRDRRQRLGSRRGSGGRNERLRVQRERHESPRPRTRRRRPL